MDLFGDGMKIIVKSVPEMWEKERSGRKKATVRKLDGKDTIIFVNTETGEKFERRITDITVWEDLIVISYDELLEQKEKFDEEMKFLITKFDLDLVNKFLPEGVEMVYENGCFWLRIKRHKGDRNDATEKQKIFG